MQSPKPPNPQSNNPFRESMTIDPASSSTHSLPPPLSPRLPLYKTPSTTTTIAEEPEQDRPSNETTRTVVAPCLTLGSLPMEKLDKDDEAATVTVVLPPACARPSGDRRPSIERRPSNMRCSMQAEDEGMWPSRRRLQKQKNENKRMWTLIKIGIAVLIIGAAVAIGLGISKAVKDANRK